ncbi:hypothetical protein STEG23_033525, partial [Scotinomys teguina]
MARLLFDGHGIRNSTRNTALHWELNSDLRLGSRPYCSLGPITSPYRLLGPITSPYRRSSDAVVANAFKTNTPEAEGSLEFQASLVYRWVRNGFLVVLIVLGMGEDVVLSLKPALSKIGDEMEPGTNSFRVEFPDFSSTILQKLNQQRQQGQLCDVSIVVQGHIFRAHKAVLAASSPYFCDQVLLKNSRRIVLPDVMNPRVFENILLSSYTGRLVMPAPEIVSYLTAASFLQMWHVVDKCTEVLEGNPTVLCQKLNHGSDHQSPSSSNYNGLVESFELGSGGHADFPKAQELRDGENEEESTKDELSSQLTEQEYLPSNSSTEHDRLSTEMASQDGEEGASDSAEFHYTRPLYSKPSIMAHKRWIHVKPERLEQACEGMDVHAAYDEHQVTESVNTMQTEHLVQPSGVEEDFQIVEKKVEAEFDEQAEESNYDEQVDFYGSSMEEFSGE